MVNNSLANRQEKKLTFSEFVRSEPMTKAIGNAISNPKAQEKFVTSLVATVTNNPMLGQCQPATIVSAALQGLALNLSPSPSLGEYWLVPYKKKDGYIAQFQIGVAGIIQLAQRTGKYADLDSIEIREGEYIGRNSETGKPMFKFIEDDEEREKKKVIGYLAYYELLNGFKHSVFFSKEKVLNWADRYSKSFDKKLYLKMQDGKGLTEEENRKITSPWYTSFDNMAKNTVMKQCLKHAPKSIEMQQIDEMEFVEEEKPSNESMAATFFGDIDNVEPAPNTPKENAVIAEDGEVVEKKETQKKATKKKEETKTDDAIVENFFGDVE